MPCLYTCINTHNGNSLHLHQNDLPSSHLTSYSSNISLSISLTGGVAKKIYIYWNRVVLNICNKNTRTRRQYFNSAKFFRSKRCSVYNNRSGIIVSHGFAKYGIIFWGATACYCHWFCKCENRHCKWRPKGGGHSDPKRVQRLCRYRAIGRWMRKHWWDVSQFFFH